MSPRNIPVILQTQCHPDRYISIIPKHFPRALSKHKRGRGGGKKQGLKAAITWLMAP